MTGLVPPVVLAVLAGIVPATAAPATADLAGAVTLVTGDQVRLLRQPGGAPGVMITPGPGREHVGFIREAGPGAADVSVIPSDASALVAAGRVDRRLFNVSELTRRRRDDTPLIVTSAAPPPGVTKVRDLPSVGGIAVRQNPKRTKDFWDWVTRSASPTQVWLDGIGKPAVDTSVPRVGAPRAWQSGFTGKGVTVGVLDSGIKADHPDLAGKVVEAKDFTGTRPDARDDLGHGTHVAGIIASASSVYRGVAPDTKLISGKVCVDHGCPDSAVIAGMEWIAPKAKVVNLSLGGAATDGTDPVSQALNRLSAQHGTLFVVSAGNDRNLDGADPLASVTAPASADAALAVGSVSKEDTTSPFSPRGPRTGDLAVKPDIAAPGAEIVSARAPGTRDGDLAPVDALYATLSGTSMAAPHAAGAAALLAQQHPDWKADRLKAALTGSARPTADALEQGAGRLDIGRAVTQQVTAISGGVSFGFLSWPYKRSDSKTVTYRNDGAAPVTLDLAAAGPFTPSSPKITVPANGTASVGVVADPVGKPAGRHGGRLTATAPGTVVQTALAAVLEGESYDLKVELISRTGRPNGGVAKAVNTETGAAYGLRPNGTARLPKGRYDINAFDLSDDPANKAQPLAVTALSKTGFVVGKDAVVTLDARQGKPIRAAVDRQGAKFKFGQVALLSGKGDRISSLGWTAGPAHQLYAVGTETQVSDHTYAFTFRVGLVDSSATYQLAFLERGRIPANTTYRVRDHELAKVESRYHAQGAPAKGLRADYARLAVQEPGIGVYETTDHAVPSKRTEFFTAHPDVTWRHVLASFVDGNDSENTWSYRSYKPGSYQVGWNKAAMGPAFGNAEDGWAVQRAGNQLSVGMPLLSGSDPDQYISPAEAMTGTTTLARVGGTPESVPGAGMASFTIPDAPGRYTLRTEATRSVPWSVIGTRIDTTWTFAEPGASKTAPLPLMVVRASGPVDDQNRASGRLHPLSLLVQRQPGSVRSDVVALTVEASFDDGVTWKHIPVLRVGERGLAVVEHPGGSGFVGLRIGASDAAGGSVLQTVLRAYRF
ncbi:S8 family serine peptidase [Allokutzneria sp. A3M-2-11 16]|uniref:S8 family peptidase n=1 Tax=Allokutzneria sp. A3M-2-11 16 TaxID=2962043 RepID=UPI0020B814CC|nr:S8 family serine peptidase [Allokutzneria sp. A3M-2-11 16]MCP3802568.1 S8 family serine peptidase [Allokutzneria sp. A3M-2-11 16]